MKHQYDLWDGGFGVLTLYMQEGMAKPRLTVRPDARFSRTLRPALPTASFASGNTSRRFSINQSLFKCTLCWSGKGEASVKVSPIPAASSTRPGFNLAYPGSAICFLLLQQSFQQNHCKGHALFCITFEHILA